jgi:16S rRNA (guanine966-N2)-methyltransferase
MHILAGRFKGRTIRTYRKAPYRPTQARVRKSLFDMLPGLEDAVVLDLYAGTGIIGFEAASRGAKQVVFVEHNPRAIQYLHQNCKLFAEVDFAIETTEASKYLQNCGQFDLIFADPPYREKAFNSLIDLSLAHLNIGGHFVLETTRSATNFTGDRIKVYGDTKLTIWSKKQ